MVTDMSEETKRQVIEMSVGIVIHNLVIFLVCLIWFRSFSNFLGVLIGMAAAILSLCSMAHSTELCVDAADEHYAQRKMTIHAICRSLLLFTVMALLWKFTEINLFTVVLGILGLKTGAYLYPAVHKFMNHKAENNRA